MADSFTDLPSRKRQPKVGFFPKMLPDELVYSAVARFSALSLLSFDSISERLFARRYAFPVHDLPAGTCALASSTGVSDAKQLILDHTLYKFFVALKSESAQKQLMSAMLCDGTVHVKVFGRNSLVPRPVRLRRCLSCDQDNERQFGTAFWQRRHQLPTSLVCVEHRLPLYASLVSCARLTQEYRTVPHSDVAGTPLLPVMSDNRFRRYVDLAEKGYALLYWNYPVGTKLKRSLRYLAKQAGYSHKARDRSIAIRRLEADFIADSGDILSLWPWLGSKVSSVRKVNWIRDQLMTTKHQSRCSFTYAVLQSFLSLKNDGYEFELDRLDFTDCHIDLSAKARRLKFEDMAEDRLRKKIFSTVARIKAECPPTRVTAKEIYTRMDMIEQSSLNLSSNRLRSIVLDYIESGEEIKIRRAQYLILEAERCGRSVTDSDFARVISCRSMDEIRAIRALAQASLDIERSCGVKTN